MNYGYAIQIGNQYLVLGAVVAAQWSYDRSTLNVWLKGISKPFAFDGQEEAEVAWKAITDYAQAMAEKPLTRTH